MEIGNFYLPKKLYPVAALLIVFVVAIILIVIFVPKRPVNDISGTYDLTCSQYLKKDETGKWFFERSWKQKYHLDGKCYSQDLSDCRYDEVISYEKIGEKVECSISECYLSDTAFKEVCLK